MKSEAQEGTDACRHYPVMLAETLSGLKPRPGGLYVDGTLGAAGHAAAILEGSSPDGKLIGIDCDPQALDLARRRLKDYIPRAILVPGNFSHLDAILENLGITAIDGVLLDLGTSRMQLTEPERGFSFEAEGALDMRMNPETPVNAADLLQRLTEKELADIIFKLGEERFSRRIARRIVERRKTTRIETTTELAELVRRAVPRPKGTYRIHPATRTFMALRIAVNHELEHLSAALPQAIGKLKPGGRIAIISFHSLEDRLVKQAFQKFSGRCVCPPERISCTCGAQKLLRIITPKPLRPSEKETAENPPSRSARLRVAERI